MRFQLAVIARYFREAWRAAASPPHSADALERAELAYARAERRLALLPWVPQFAPQLKALFKEQERLRVLLDREKLVSSRGLSA